MKDQSPILIPKTKYEDTFSSLKKIKNLIPHFYNCETC